MQKGSNKGLGFTVKERSLKLRCSVPGRSRSSNAPARPRSSECTRFDQKRAPWSQPAPCSESCARRCRCSATAKRSRGGIVFKAHRLWGGADRHRPCARACGRGRGRRRGRVRRRSRASARPRQVRVWGSGEGERERRERERRERERQRETRLRALRAPRAHTQGHARGL